MQRACPGRRGGRGRRAGPRRSARGRRRGRARRVRARSRRTAACPRCGRPGHPPPPPRGTGAHGSAPGSPDTGSARSGNSVNTRQVTDSLDCSHCPERGLWVVSPKTYLALLQEAVVAQLAGELQHLAELLGVGGRVRHEVVLHLLPVGAGPGQRLARVERPAQRAVQQVEAARRVLQALPRALQPVTGRQQQQQHQVSFKQNKRGTLRRVTPT
jgi:hypothetical protein